MSSEYCHRCHRTFEWECGAQLCDDCKPSPMSHIHINASADIRRRKLNETNK